ncbi:MAG: hypothetical protein AB1560_13460 [Pseudomonadota bacterium]
MSTVAQIRTKIKDKLAAVIGIGQVHDYERYKKTDADFQALYKTDVGGGAFRILGWNFYREATSESDLNNGEVRRIHAWRITGFMGIDDADATGKTFDDLVETVATAFRADRTLGGTVLDIKDMDQPFGESGIQVEAIEPVMFAGVLCHRARLRLLTETTEPS